MIGLGSRSGTTTFTVADLPELGPASYREMLHAELVACGWVLEEPDEAWLARFAQRHLAYAAELEVGEILEIGANHRLVRRTK